MSTVFRFMDLPKSIRLSIYRLLTPTKADLLMDRNYWQLFGHPHRVGPVSGDMPLMDDILALLFVCRQIHDEALPILYGENAVVVHDLDFIRCCVSQHVLRHITCIKLQPNHYYITHTKFQQKRYCIPYTIIKDQERNCWVVHGKHAKKMLSAVDEVLASVYHPPRKFRFAHLPTEIRHMILSYTDLVAPGKIGWGPLKRYSRDQTRGYSVNWGYRKWVPNKNHYEFHNGHYQYYTPGTSRMQYWWKPIALFLVSKSFSQDAQHVFFSQNQFDLGQWGISWPSWKDTPNEVDHVKQFFDRLNSQAFRSLRSVEIGQKLLFHEGILAPSPGREWLDLVDAHKSKLNLRLMSLYIRTLYLPETIVEAPDHTKLSCISEMVDDCLWPLDTVRRIPGVQVLVIRFLSSSFLGYYYLRRPCDALPGKAAASLKIAEKEFVQLLTMKSGRKTNITDGLQRNKDGLLEVRSDLKDSDIYKDALIEGFWIESVIDY